MTSRREFVKQVGGVALAASLPNAGGVRARAAKGRIRLGYASITWNERDKQAIDDISALGFPGIQLRSNVLASIGRDPRALRQLLAEHHLTFVALSSGNVSIDPAEESRTVDEHVGHAQWLKDAGGLYLQLIAERPPGGVADQASLERLGRILTEIGKRTEALGIPAVFHPHVGSLSETPDETARVLQASDSRYVHLLLDVAHWQQGGGDPPAAIHQYHDRLRMLHIKDVRPARGGGRGAAYEFVELGHGTVNLPAVFRALRDVAYDGWAVVELDSVPEDSSTPAASAAISKAYLKRVIGMPVG